MEKVSVFFIAKLLFIITTLFTSLSTPCLSYPQPPHLQVLSSYYAAAKDDHKELSHTKLPRKLTHMEDTLVNVDYIRGDQLSRDTKKSGGAILLGKIGEQRMMDGRKGTRQKWIESNKWQYFTMDYAHVQRRRPVHNKAVPFSP